MSLLSQDAQDAIFHTILNMLGNQEALQDLMDEVRRSYSYLELTKSGNGGRFRKCCYQGTWRRRDGAIPGERGECERYRTLAPSTIGPRSAVANTEAARNPLAQVKCPDLPNLVNHIQP